jgi:hypothetical protein
MNKVPNADECALLVLHLRQSREEEKEKPLSRFRLSELTLKRICCRPRIHEDFFLTLQDSLLRMGWALFYADRSYGVISLDAVEAWTRLGSKRIRAHLDAVANGKFDFAPLAGLAVRAQEETDD